ncbi:cell wall-binding repeat-containing protein [Pseudolysinimonas sp.]|uniref:cell wall-binding repeat-containing protein n=1 Tax=Pseudolysinimonas sp. TaxID=2680009 RepID=UPI00286A6ED8|nr:cell wall-binding repeat-containing protein [Pseudolysinimonas sp.]
MRLRRTFSTIVLTALVAALSFAAPLSAAQAASTATLTGIVTMPDGSTLDGSVRVYLYRSSVSGLYRNLTTNSASGGVFTFSNLPPNSYRLMFLYDGPSADVASFAWPSAPADPSLGADVLVGDGTTVDMATVPLMAGGRISGSLAGIFGQISTAQISVFTTGPGSFKLSTAVNAFDAATDTYTTDALPPGSYVIGFAQPFDFSRNETLWIPEYSGDTPDYESATPLTVASAQVTTYDAQVTGYPTISGTIYLRNEDGSLSVASGSGARATRANGESVFGGTSPDGTYRITNLYANEPYTVCSGGADNTLTTCWSDGDVDEIVLDYNESATGIDLILEPGGQITGNVTYQSSGLQNATGAEAQLWLDDAGRFELVATDLTYAGQFEFHSIAPGTYVVRIDASGVTNGFSELVQLNSEYWEDSRFAWEADPIEVTAGSAIDLDFALEGRSIRVGRVTGTDRFGTSVEVSQLIFGPDDVPAEGIPVVYLANGLNYPDALAAGPAAIHNEGVVLLTFPWSLPPVVEAELERLRPQRIVLVGGEPSINSSVEALLDDLSFNPEVDRITGLNRFGTSREIAEDTYADGADVAFIATGLNYPDALAAGPPAGMLGAPIILVNGGASTLDQATEDILADLGVSQVYVIGGTPSVSAGIYARLQTLFGSYGVTRLTGSDRFGTAIAISQQFYTDADLAFLATGLNFPDALAGGPAAGYFGGPLYLSRQDCVQAPVVDDIFDVRANGLILLGGPPSLSMNVQNGVICG